MNDTLPRKPDEMMTFIDRLEYEKTCWKAGISPLPDDEAVIVAETGFERLYLNRQRGCTDLEQSILATHIRRGYSVIGLVDESGLI